MKTLKVNNYVLICPARLQMLYPNNNAVVLNMAELSKDLVS